jgi:acetylornithine deacetylase
LLLSYLQQTNMKPTQISCTPGSLNQLPPECTVQGDIRVTPFYHTRDVIAKVNEYVAEINANPNVVITMGHGDMPMHGPHSKYELPDEELKGRLEMKWIGEGENGVACKLDSEGYSAILKATEKVLGSVKPYAIGGSLPLIRDLQDQGFDVQIAGYGISARYVLCVSGAATVEPDAYDDVHALNCRYHADNESASLTSLKNATKIIAEVTEFLSAVQLGCT